MNKLFRFFRTVNFSGKYYSHPLVLCFALLVSSCDGGLFGTGDGSGPIDLSNQNSSAQIEEVDTNDAGETNTPTDTIDGDASTGANVGAPLIPTDTTFNNTTPAGSTNPSNDLPGVKLINLSGEELQIQVSTNPIDTLGDTDFVQVRNTSRTLPLNNTGNQVFVESSATLERILSINPLTTASDSLTTVLVSPDSDSSNRALDTFIFDTRVAVPANNTIQVRVISLIDNDVPNDALSFVLEPTVDNNSGAQLVFTDERINAISISDYALNNPGAYTLSANNNAFLPIEITLLNNEVYTLIVTSNEQVPVYLENDTE